MVHRIVVEHFSRPFLEPGKSSLDGLCIKSHFYLKRIDICDCFIWTLAFLRGCTTGAVWPSGLGNFDKNFLANLATELLAHSVW